MYPLPGLMAEQGGQHTYINILRWWEGTEVRGEQDRGRGGGQVGIIEI